MPKVSRPVIYTALAAVAAYALVLNTQPDKPAAKRVTRLTRSTQTTDPNGLLPADLKAHFPRYAGGARDPFAAGVALSHPRTAAASSSAVRGQAGWSLTGISAVNGVASALIENSATGESVFLQPGDRWNGLRVVSIRPDRVLFQNGLGRQDALPFAQPADDGTGGGTAAVGGAPRQPGVGLSLPPYPVTPLRAVARGPARRRCRLCRRCRLLAARPRRMTTHPRRPAASRRRRARRKRQEAAVAHKDNETLL